MTKFVTQFNGRRVIGVEFTEPTMTKQAPANEVDINQIMDRYLRTGVLPDPRPAHYGDATAIPSYEEAMNIVNQGREAFEALPSKIRERFGNDPGKFLDFVNDESNYDEAVQLGLVAPKEASEATKPAPEAEPVATQTGEASSQ